MSEEQWSNLEEGVRQSIRELPDAAEFTVNDIGRIVARVRRINNDVLETSATAARDIEIEGMDRVFQPVYAYLIGEIIGLCIEVVRLDKQIGADNA